MHPADKLKASAEPCNLGHTLRHHQVPVYLDVHAPHFEFSFFFSSTFNELKFQIIHFFFIKKKLTVKTRYSESFDLAERMTERIGGLLESDVEKFLEVIRAARLTCLSPLENVSDPLQNC